MTRTHAAIRLLEHGPLNKREFAEITGWSLYDCMKTLGWLQETGRVVFDGAWRLA
jgi:hypothetical protein